MQVLKFYRLQCQHRSGKDAPTLLQEKKLPYNSITVLYNHIQEYRKQSQQNFTVLNNYVLTLKYNSQYKSCV